MRKNRWKRVGISLVMLLLSGVILAVLWKSQPAVITPQELIEKYRQQDKQQQKKTRYGVGQKESFTYEFAYDFSDESVKVWNEILTVHTERRCLEESRIVTGTEVKSTKTGCRVTVHPIEQALASISDKETGDSWGSAPVYYLAVRYDRKAEDKRRLDQPIVIPFILQSPCAVPNLEGETDEEGVFRLRWSPVKGAEEYRIYNYCPSEETEKESSASGAECGYHGGSLLFEKRVKETSFESFAGDGNNAASLHSYKDGREIVFGQNFCIQGDYYVTAVVAGKESIMSNAVRTTGCKLPHKVVEEQDILYGRYGSAGELPRSVPVENTDGTVEERNVLYTFRPGTNILGEKRPQYDYRIEGTRLKGYVVMTGKEGTSYPDKVGTPSLAGKKEPRDELDKVPQVKEKSSGKTRGKEAAVPVLDAGYYVKADSASEEWLALNLIAGEEEFYIGDFPELTEPETLRERFYHVYYQNPYVFGIAAFRCDYERLVLHIEYLYSGKERQQMRRQMRERAENILDETGLTGERAGDWRTEEKIRIIYQWLEEHTAYDTEAYQDSIAHRHRKTGETYEYAHNAWGLFTKGKGMCQGYSDAFLLLCHMAGIEAEAVTGSISQSIPHVWNAVCLAGNWYYVDATNNTHNTGESPCLYLAGRKQAAAEHYVCDPELFEKEEDPIVISEKNFDSD